MGIKFPIHATWFVTLVRLYHFPKIFRRKINSVKSQDRIIILGLKMNSTMTIDLGEYLALDSLLVLGGWLSTELEDSIDDPCQL